VLDRRIRGRDRIPGTVGQQQIRQIDERVALQGEEVRRRREAHGFTRERLGTRAIPMDRDALGRRAVPPDLLLEGEGRRVLDDARDQRGRLGVATEVEQDQGQVAGKECGIGLSTLLERSVRGPHRPLRSGDVAIPPVDQPGHVGCLRRPSRLRQLFEHI